MPQNIMLQRINNKKPQILFNDKKGTIQNNTVKINSEETMVIKWTD